MKLAGLIKAISEITFLVFGHKKVQWWFSVSRHLRPEKHVSEDELILVTEGGMGYRVYDPDKSWFNQKILKYKSGTALKGNFIWGSLFADSDKWIKGPTLSEVCKKIIGRYQKRFKSHLKDFNPIKDAKRIGNNRAEAILEKIDKLVEQIILTDSPLGNHYSLDLSFVADTCKSASIYISALKPEYQLPEKEYVRDFEIIRVDGMSSLSVMLKKLYLKLENHLRETKALYHTEPSKTGDTLAKLTFDVLRHQVKFTRADGTDLWSGEIDYSQPAGTVITAPDWNGKAECGGGLHFANAVRALIYHPKGKGNLISRAFWVHPTGKEISLNSGIRKTESLMVIRELNILEILSGIAQYAYCPSVRQFAEERLRALEVA